MLTKEQLKVVQSLQIKVNEWLRDEGQARSTLAGAIVTIDAARRRAPFLPEDLFTRGGQLNGGRGSALKATLFWYGEGREFLKDGVTTRSTKKFERLANAIEWGAPLSGWTRAEREEAVRVLAQPILNAINAHFERQHLIIRLDRQLSPLTWVEEMLSAARDRSQGRVEQHLVWSKLKTRHPDLVTSEHAAFAGDVQTGRAGDIVVGELVFHVTAAPTASVIEKCERNLQSGQYPVLLTPRPALERAKTIAETVAPQSFRRITFFAIEDFLASNILEMAQGDGRRFFEVVQQILRHYNAAVERVETDSSLRIEIE